MLNATGVVVHTNLGRAPLAAEARAAVARAAEGYANLEFDLDAGERGSRQAHVEALLRELTGAEAALAVNNCAAATLLAAAALASGRDLVVSRGQAIEIGGAFRIPEVIAQAGARMVEVGTTNRTRLADYAAVLGDDTGAILRAHPSNFRTVGFVEAVEIEALCSLGVPVIDDVGSGVLADDLEALADEPAVRRSVRAGAAVVCFSGDKLLGGPQAGLIVGERDAIAACRRHPLARAVRIDKLSLAALEATLRLYRDPAHARRGDPGARDARRRPVDPRRPGAAPGGRDRRHGRRGHGPRRRRRAPAPRARRPGRRARPRPGRRRRVRDGPARRRPAARRAHPGRPPAARPAHAHRRGGRRRGARRARRARMTGPGTSAPLTVGTAGHIDHGKTALIAALTGVDTDRLPEEKARGISIALGYAPLRLPSGRRVSVVDVPGHERFVRTMVAGATGIDLYLMVVAADDGVMPQTVEHAAVLTALGVTDGVVAITKADIADPGPAAEAARELMGDVEIVACSARTGMGVPDVAAALDRVAARVASRAGGRRRGAPPRRPLVHDPRRGDGRDRHAVVGQRRARRRPHAPAARRCPCACAASRSTTSPSSAPRRASASR